MSTEEEDEDNVSRSSKEGEADPNDSIIEEKEFIPKGEIQITKYKKGQFLGKGGFAKCYEFSCLKNKKLFAGKIITRSSLGKSSAKKRLLREIKIQKSLNHPQIVKLEHYFEDEENIYLLLELCQNQTLIQLLKHRKKLTEIEVQCYTIQLINALIYLHSNKIIHRDLKLKNLFLTDKMELKVGDFGLSTKLDFEGERKRKICGTPNYIAPEMLNGKTGYTYKVDIWALGVIIYTLIIGKPPFESIDKKTIYKRIKMNDYYFPKSIKISEAAKNLISQILVIDQSKRPSLDQILKHDFFNLGTSIPKTLPVLTLTCAPSISYIREYMPDAGEDGIVNKSLTKTQLNYLKSNEDKKIDSNIKGPDIWVKKWANYSHKYGLGYLLSNGFFGVLFIDRSKIILDPETKIFFYIDKKNTDMKETIVKHKIDDYPKELEKKVVLLKHFKMYLEEDNNKINVKDEKAQQNENQINEEKEIDVKPFTYVKNWTMTTRAVMFRLSNKVVHLCFKDHTEVILTSESNIVTYVNRKQERSTYLLNKNNVENLDYEMVIRLNYTRELLIHMLNMNSNKSSEKNQSEIGSSQYQNEK